MRRILTLLGILLAFSLLPAFAHGQGYGYKGVLKDIYLNITPNEIYFANSKLVAYFVRGGENTFWLYDAQTGLGITTSSNLQNTVDVRINGLRVVSEHPSTFLRFSVSISPQADSVTLQMIYGVGPKSADRHRYELTCSYTLYPEEARLERSGQIHWAIDLPDNTPVEAFQGFLFASAHQSRGNNPHEQIEMLGTPLSPRVERQLPSAPDSGYGIVALTNPASEECILYWMDTHQGETHYTPTVSYNADSTNLQFYDHRAHHFIPGSTISSDTLRMEKLTGNLSDGLLRYRQWVQGSMPLAPQTPTWIKQATLLQIAPAHFKGGFREIAQKLPLYHQSGFSTIALMPHWEGGDAPLDPNKVNPAYGTEADLKNLVQQAHALGMRVLFEIALHGFNPKSPALNQSPAMFIREPDGNWTKHPVWKSISTNWANPAYHDYMASLALNDIRLYNIDGYRVVGANYKPEQGYFDMTTLAYQSGTYSPRLLRGILKTAQSKKRDFALLIEAPGTVFHTVCNFVQDGSVERISQLAERVEQGKANAEEVKENIGIGLEALPKGANRVFELKSSLLRSKTIEAILALCGIPMVFSGSAPLNAQEQDWYRRLFALRKQFPELAQGELLLGDIASSHPMVFTALRRLKDHYAVIVVNLAKQSVKTALSARFARLHFSTNLIDPTKGKPLLGTLSPSGEFRLTLSPNQVLIGELSEGTTKEK